MHTYHIERKKLYEITMEKITDLMVSGSYKVGDRLPTISELSNLFNVGKPSIREALNVLATLGIVEIRHGSGTYITALPGNRETEIQNSLHKVFTETENKSLSDWMAFRLAIELAIAELAAVCATPEDIARIEQCYKNLKSSFNTADMELKHGYHFHYCVALASHNDIFIAIMSDWDKKYSYYFELDQSIRTSTTPSRELRILREHHDILEAIKNHQPEKAREAMSVHLREVRDKIDRFVGTK